MKHRDEFGDSNSEIGCSFFMLFRMGGGRIPSVGFLEGWNTCESTDKTKQRINFAFLFRSLANSYTMYVY